MTWNSAEGFEDVFASQLIQEASTRVRFPLDQVLLVHSGLVVLEITVKGQTTFPTFACKHQILLPIPSLEFEDSFFRVVRRGEVSVIGLTRFRKFAGSRYADLLERQSEYLLQDLWRAQRLSAEERLIYKLNELAKSYNSWSSVNGGYEVVASRNAVSKLIGASREMVGRLLRRNSLKEHVLSLGVSQNHRFFIRDPDKPPPEELFRVRRETRSRVGSQNLRQLKSYRGNQKMSNGEANG